ncbi:hypothetical protein ACJJTC_002638 [Scirpophaga incertulas]
MPKRRNSGDSEECISRKIRKLERKLKRRLERNKRILSSSSDSPGPVLTPECRSLQEAIKKEVREHLFDTEIDTYLFGEKLPETLKAAKAINKSGTELRSALAVQKSAPVTKKASTTVPLSSRPQLGSRVQPPTRRRFESEPGPSRQRLAPLAPPPLPPPPPPRRSGYPQTRTRRRR